MEKEDLMFARVLVEIKIDQDFPEIIQFMNEHGKIMEQKVYYHWKPIRCVSCKGYGNNKDKYVKPQKARQMWVKKQKQC